MFLNGYTLQAFLLRKKTATFGKSERGSRGQDFLLLTQNRLLHGIDT